jgi:putative membrane protein
MHKDAYYNIPHDKLILRDRLAWHRTTLANERTFLSYIRAGITMVVAGITFIRFFDWLWIVVLGWALIAGGVAAYIIGQWRFIRHKHVIMQELMRPDEPVAKP